MKAKIKLDGAAIKGGFVRHVEKMLFGIVGLCFVWLVYSATRVQQFTRTPEELRQVSNETDLFLKNQQFDKEAIDNYSLANARDFREAQAINPLAELTVWKPISAAPQARKRRGSPTILAPLDLQVSAGIGAIAMRATPLQMVQKQKEQLDAERKAQEELQEQQERDMRDAQRGTGRPGYGTPYGPTAAMGPEGNRARGGARGATPYGPTPYGPMGGEGGRARGARGAAGPYGPTPYGPTGPYGPTATTTQQDTLEEAPEQPMIVPTQDMVLKGERWVAITAPVPAKKQASEYKKALGSSDYADPMRDMPSYKLYEIQRAEYLPGKALAESDWQQLKNEDVVAAVLQEPMEKWGAQYPEIADPEAVNPWLTMPLPPLVSRNWGEEVAHAPEIPMQKFDPMAAYDPLAMLEEAAEAQAAATEQPADGEATTESSEEPASSGSTPADVLIQQPTNPLDLLKNGGGMGPSYGPAGRAEGSSPYGPSPYGPGRSPYGPAGPYGPGPTRSPYGPSGPYGRSPYGPTGPYGPAGASPYAMTGAVTPEYYLMRFFDFTVESGKTYVYRVRLRLDNPNHRMETNQLEKPTYADDEFLFSDWSAPSGEVRVPGDNALLAGGTSLTRGQFDPTAQVVVEHFDQGKGVSASITAERVVRGQVANLKPSDIEYVDPVKGTVETLEKVDMSTGMTVVDMLGGAKVGKKAVKTSFGRMLIMDDEGNFDVREEQTDRSAFTSATAGQKRVQDIKDGVVQGGAMPYGPTANPYGPRAPSAAPYGPSAAPYGPAGATRSGYGDSPYGPGGGAPYGPAARER